MPYQILIHFKNDEEVTSPSFEDFWEHPQYMAELLHGQVTSEDGFDPEDVQFIQVEPI